MTLDERVRVGLRRSADTGHLDEDEVFNQIRTAYERGRVRARVIRQATTVAVVLTLIAGVGVFISLRAASDRYRTTSTVAVTEGVPGHPRDPLTIARAPSTQRAALLAAHVPRSESGIRFDATRSGKNRLSLAVTSPSTAESTLVTRQWVAAMTPAMKAYATRELIAQERAVVAKFKALHAELRRVDLKLMKIAPLVYHGVLKFDAPNGSLPRIDPNAPAPVPEQGTVGELNLAFLRIQILQQIAHLGEEASTFRFNQRTSNIYARTIGPTSTTRVSHTPRATWITLSGWLVALLLVLIGGVLIYRRRATSASVSRS
jgi:hypothetical protein